jgi:hypothetical protein
VEMANVAVHPEITNEEGEVETVGKLQDWYGDRHLVVGHFWQLKKQTEGNGGSQKKLATVSRWMTYSVFLAWRKGCGHKGQMVENRRQKSGSRTMLYEEPLKDIRLRTDDRRC